jgi:predicted permease
MMKSWLRRLGGVFGKERRDRELTEEFDAHLQAHIEDNLRAGMTGDEARRRAHLALGGLDIAKEQYRERGGIPMLETLFQDLRYALRTMLKNRGFTAVALVTLALGIGFNTAVFSLVHTVLLRPLPYHDPERLVAVWNRWDGVAAAALSNPEFLDYSERSTTIAMAATAADEVTIGSSTADPERVFAASVTANAFDVLGIAPALGRGFRAGEDSAGHDGVAILSDALWRRRFGASPLVVGQRVLIDGAPVEVIGVLRPDVVLPSALDSNTRFDVIVPLVLDRAAPRNRRGGHYLEVFGRLAPGATAASASSEMTTILAPLMREYPDQHNQGGFGIVVRPLRDDRLGPARPILGTLMATVGLVLVLACANVANLLLARGKARRRELAVRGALGASRLRLARQLITEAMALSTAGAAAGVAVAVACQRAFLIFGPAALPRMQQLSLSRPVLAFAAGLAVLSGLLFGAFPVIQMAASDADPHVEGVRGGGGPFRGRVRNALIVAQVAIALILLVASGLVVNSFVRLLKVPSGFQSDRVMTLRIALPPSRYPERIEAAAFFSRVLERIRVLPGVDAAGASSGLPLAVGTGDWSFDVAGRPRLNGRRPGAADAYAVTPGYFEALRIPLRRGRLPSPADAAETTPVAFINEATARVVFPNVDPIGQRIQPARSTGPEQPWRTIVGVVADVHHRGLDAAPRPEMYFPNTQYAHFAAGAPARAMSLVVKTGGAASGLANVLRSEIHRIDPQIPAADVREMDAVVSNSVADRRLNVVLIGTFGALALILAAIGLYGVMAYTVTQRTREMGIRLAIGASATNVLTLIAGEGLRLVGVGLVIGLCVAIPLAGSLDRFLFGIPARDLSTFAAATAVLVCAGALACYVPARRAMRVDPVVALRDE